MLVTLFDVETTGLPLWNDPSDHPGQPHLCQFTGVLFDDQTGEELEYIDMLVKPDGWTISEELSAIHGITHERALADGLPEKEAVDWFLAMLPRCQRVSGFNTDFDIRLMRIAFLRAGITKADADLLAAEIKAKKHDVMRQATPVCKLPPTDKMLARNIKTFKSPTLAEAVKTILGEDMADAHDARADVLATLRLYRHLNPPSPA